MARYQGSGRDPTELRATLKPGIDAFSQDKWFFPKMFGFPGQTATGKSLTRRRDSVELRPR